MPDYANGKIYKIVCNITGDQYIGATTQNLSQRLTGHVRRKNTDKCYKSKDIILRGDYQIVLIENYSCNSKEELERKEREHIEANICVNKFIPTRTQKEYRESHKEEIILGKKEYYNTHKDEIKLYKEKNKDAIMLKQKEYNNAHKEARALYSKNNRDEINRKRRERYNKNKDAYKELYNANKDELNKKRRESRNKKKQEKLVEGV
jgi:hypothetical protein